MALFILSLLQSIFLMLSLMLLLLWLIFFMVLIKMLPILGTISGTFFFLMILPPPCSTLFPYTTLFRSLLKAKLAPPEPCNRGFLCKLTMFLRCGASEEYCSAAHLIGRSEPPAVAGG